MYKILFYIPLIMALFSTPLFAKEINNYYLVAIPPDIPADKAKQFHSSFINLLYELHENDYLEVINSKTVNKVDEVKIPRGISKTTFGKKRFFKRNLKKYAKFLGSNKLKEKVNDVNIRKIIDYARNIKTINSDAFTHYKLIIYGSMFSEITNKSEDKYYSYDLKDISSIYKKSSEHYFGTSDRETILDGVNVFIYTTDEGSVAERFLTTYICNQSGVINVYTNNIASINVIASKKSVLLKSRFTCQRFDQNKIATAETRKKKVKTEEIFKTVIVKNPPPPVSNIGYMKVGLRWNYDSCIKKQHDCDLDLIIKPSKFEQEVFYKHKESTTYGWYKKLDPKNGRNSYEVVDLARAPVKIDNVTVYINFFSGQAPQGIDAELRVVFNDQIYYKELHIKASKGNRGKGNRNKSKNWIKVNLNDLLQPMKAEK